MPEVSTTASGLEPHRRPIACAMAGALVAVTLWGLAPVATRAGVSHIAPLPLLVLRMSGASLALLPWAVPAFRRLGTLRQASRLGVAGVLGIVGYTLPVTYGLRWLHASTAGLLLASEPIWVMLIGRVFLGQRLASRAWAGSAIALAGVAVLAGPATLTGSSPVQDLAGAGLVLAGTLAFGAYTIMLRPLSEAFGALSATAAATMVGSVPLLAFAGTLSGSRLTHVPASAWGELGFLALGSSVAGMALWNRAVVSLGSVRVSQLLYLEPVVSVSGSVVLLGERVTPVMLVAGLVIITGVAVAGRAAPPEELEVTANGWRNAPFP